MLKLKAKWKFRCQVDFEFSFINNPTRHRILEILCEISANSQVSYHQSLPSKSLATRHRLAETYLEESGFYQVKSKIVKDSQFNIKTKELQYANYQ